MTLPWQTFFGFYMWGAHWRHLANTTEPFVCGGDAALCQITLTSCYVSHLLINLDNFYYSLVTNHLVVQVEQSVRSVCVHVSACADNNL